MKIITKEFGTVEFITKEESQVGLLIRQNNSGLVLERYYKKNKVLVCEVLEEFEYASLYCTSDIRKCLGVARTYKIEKPKTIFIEWYSPLESSEYEKFLEEYNLEDNEDSLDKFSNDFLNNLRK